MIFLIVLALLAIAAVIGTVVILPQGQDNRYADRQRNASQYETNRIF